MSVHRGRSLRSGDWDSLWLGFPRQNCAHKARQLEVVGMGGGSRLCVDLRALLALNSYHGYRMSLCLIDPHGKMQSKKRAGGASKVALRVKVPVTKPRDMN